MKTNAVAIVINYCSNDVPFLRPLLKEACLVTKHVYVAVSDHFFDGKKEDVKAVKNAAASFPGVQFILFPFIPNLFKGKQATCVWHGVNRLVGFHFTPKQVSHILFIDVDEVIDSKRFLDWLTTKEFMQYDFCKLYCYWYFRSASFRALNWETSPVLVKKSCLSRSLLMHKEERTGMYNEGKGVKKEGVLGWDQKPMIHHYSWVRSKQQMLKKVSSWGHKKDRDWQALVEEEFSRPFSGKDFVHGYSFETVTPFIELDLLPFEEKNSTRNFHEISLFSFYRLLFSFPKSDIKYLIHKAAGKKPLIRNRFP